MADVPAVIKEHFSDFSRALWEALADSIGADPDHEPPLLGTGSHGIALDIGRGRVLKLTDDRDEAQNAFTVHNKLHNPKYIAKIHQVFSLRNLELGGQFVCWAIVTDKLEDLDEVFKSFIYAWRLWTLDDDAMDDLLQKIPGPLTPVMVKHFYENLAVLHQDPHGNDWLLRGDTKENRDWLMGAAKELTGIGINFRDLHGKNVMNRQDGKPVIFDLGASASQKQKMPEIEAQWLEDVARAVSARKYRKNYSPKKDPSAHQIDLDDPKQNIDVDLGTSMAQLHLALNTIEAEFSAPDGAIITEQDVEAVRAATSKIRHVVRDCETRMGAYMVEKDEEPRSGDR